MYRVMIADDEELLGKCLEKMIDWNALGAEVVGVAMDGEEALEMFRSKGPEIVILDINMPFISGLELAGIINKEKPETKVIMLTAYKEFEYAQQAIKYHVVDYLTKPFDKDEVIETVCRIIDELEEEKTRRMDPAAEDKPVNLKKEETITDKVLSYIRQNYHDPELNLKGTADALFISTSYLQSLLKNQNTNFTKLLDQVRMQKAMELLKEQENVKIYEVAFEVGLNSSQYFSKKFKQYYGMEPKAVLKNRDQQKNEK